MKTNKPKVIKDFEKLEPEIQEQIKLLYPDGFYNHLVYYTNKEGLSVSALPFETDDRYYLVRMTVNQAKAIIEEEEEEYDLDGNLKDEAKDKYDEKFSDMDYLSEQISDQDVEDEE
ncbi:MAG: hypothetical protein U0W24_11720 [Bacteroidales bacterium]